MLKVFTVTNNLFPVVAVSSQMQYFRVQPRDVKVHEGGEVTMQCEVANRAGSVQWTKDGFALGKKNVYKVVLDRSGHVFVMILCF